MCLAVISSDRSRIFALLTPLVLVVHGFHPLADDGAVYVTGIKKLANPSLYQADAVFALSPTHLSIFAHVLAIPLHRGLLPLPALLLVCHLASIFLFLLGCWRVAERIFPADCSRWGAVLLAACCFTLPVAGTSLCIMDPYVTARSFSTPLSLFALAAVLDEQWMQCAGWLALAALLHPLMAIYAAIAVFTVAIAKSGRWGFLIIFLCLGWILCAVIFMRTHPAEHTSAFNLAALSRSYFFLSSWRWYEYPGLLIPMLLLGIAGARNRTPAGILAIAAFTLGAGALLISICFVHRNGSLWLARLQVLRSFQFVYIAGVLLLGGWLGALAQRHRLAIGALYLSIALALFAGQRLNYPASSHVEWPYRAPHNPWQQAFLWIRANTPRDALFALDNDYIEGPGEDAQGFRATAERSTVADYFKDGGIASNFSQAALPWLQGSQATFQLNSATDAERFNRLLPLGVTWIVLPTQASTALTCPFSNAVARVCRLKPVSQVLWSDKDREVWFSLGENHEEACRFGLHQSRNCSAPDFASPHGRRKIEQLWSKNVHADAVSKAYFRLRVAARSIGCRRPARFALVAQGGRAGS